MSVYTSLREANAARQEAWCEEGDPAPDLAFRGIELAGEVGEALNIIKKIERERHGWRGSRATLEDLADELADVVICADLAALAVGIDLTAAIVRKFNATSEKVGLPQRLKRVVPCASPEESLVAAAEADGFLSIEDIRRICQAIPCVEPTAPGHPDDPAQAVTEAQPTHRHKKRGTEYVLVGFGSMQTTNWVFVRRVGPDSNTYIVESADMHEVAIYRATDDGTLWVRPREEFEDGRFEELPS